MKEAENNEKIKQEIAEEIKGFPELSEDVYNLYNQDKTRIRFSNERSILRALMDPLYVNHLRILLSIVYLNKIDYYKKLEQLGFFNGNNTLINKSDVYAKQIYEHINYYLKKENKFPSMQWIVNSIGLPYSKEFLDEYLLDEEDLTFEINERIKQATLNTYKNLAEYLSNHSCSSSNIRQFISNVDKKYELIDLKDNFDDKFNNLEEFINQRKDDVLLSTGIKQLDENDVKLAKGKIVSVFAYTGSYKTMFCTNVAYNIIKNLGNVLYVSLEICKEEMYINFLSRHSNEFDTKISHSDVKNNQMLEKDKKYLFDVVYPDFKENLKKHLIVYDETDIGENTYSRFDKLFLKAEEKFINDTGNGIDLIVIDHLNLLKFGKDNRGQNDYSVVNHWMSYFRRNCINFLNKDKKICFLCACQSSRDGYKTALKTKKYNLTSIAEGNEIERSSQYVLSILTLDDDRQVNKTRMQILKSRDGNYNEEIIEIYLEPKYYIFGGEQNKKSIKDKYSSIGINNNMLNVFNNEVRKGVKE